jgi:hypothetical protein
MTVRTFFTILAVLSFLFGIGFVLAPGQALANYGIELSPALALVGRLFGGALLTLGIILWLARDFRDEAAVRAVLIAALVGGRRKSRCGNYGHLVRRVERAWVVHRDNLSLRGAGKRLLSDGANFATIAAVTHSRPTEGGHTIGDLMKRAKRRGEVRHCLAPRCSLSPTRSIAAR